MAKNSANEQDFLNEEVQGGEQEVNTTAPSADEAAAEAKDTRVWKLADGTEVSKSEFIRDQFTNGNKSRKQISDEFEINYRTVYGATVNMVNDAEPATRGRSASVSKINVTADGHVVTVIDGVTHVDNIAVSDEEAEALPATTEVDRNTWIKEQVEAGVERGKVAAALGLSYGVIYSMTKDAEGNKQRHEIEYGGETLSRSEYIRRRFAEGLTKSEIAKELNVDYPVVWSALKSTKSEAEKYLDAVDKLSKFADKVEDATNFAALIEHLKTVTVKADEVPSDAEQEEVAAASDSVYADGQ